MGRGRDAPGMAPRRGPPQTAPKFSTEHTPPTRGTGSHPWNVTTRKGEAGNEDGTAEVHCRQEVGTRGTPRWRRSQVRTGWRHRSAGGGPEKRDGGPGATTTGSSGLGPAAFTARGRESVTNQHPRLSEGTPVMVKCSSPAFPWRAPFSWQMLAEPLPRAGLTPELGRC